MEQKMSNWKTRQTLIQKIRDTDNHQAWDEFVNYYRDYILILLQKMGINESHRDDILQEILLSVYKYLGAYEYNPKRAQFRSWFYVMIRNQALNYIKSVKRYELRTENAMEGCDAEDFFSKPELEKLIQDEWEIYITKTAYKNIESSFNGNALKAFSLYMSGTKSREIAKQLDIKPNSVATLVNRVKIRLAEEVMRLKEQLEF